jgi:hypothetical protein
VADFQYKPSSSWVDIPTRACPEAGEGGVLVVYPRPESRTGLGVPCGAFGSPWIEIRANKMYEGGSDADGMRFWQSLFSSATALTVSIKIAAYNPRTRAWEKYSGTLERPQHDAPVDDNSGAGRGYPAVLIRVSGLTATT